MNVENVSNGHSALRAKRKYSRKKIKVPQQRPFTVESTAGFHPRPLQHEANAQARNHPPKLQQTNRLNTFLQILDLLLLNC